MSDDLEGKLLEWADKVEQVLTQIQEPAVDLVLATAQVSAAGNLLAGLVLLMTFYALWRLFSLCNTRINDKSERNTKRERYAPYEDDTPEQVGMMILFFIGAFTFFVSIFLLLNIWNWVGMFYPELYIAHKVLGL